MSRSGRSRNLAAWATEPTSELADALDLRDRTNLSVYTSTEADHDVIAEIRRTELALQQGFQEQKNLDRSGIKFIGFGEIVHLRKINDEKDITL